MNQIKTESRKARKTKMSSIAWMIGKLIENVKIYTVVKPLQFLYSSEPYEQKMQLMRSLPAGTVGHDLAKMLDGKKLGLIPGFENHDLNHLILGFGMEPDEELNMQAYLIGNGYRKLHCFLFFSSGLLLPGLWKSFYREFRRGRRTVSITQLTLDSCMSDNTEELKAFYRQEVADQIEERVVDPASIRDLSFQ